MAAIRIAGLTVRFGEVLAVDDVSIHVEEGEFVSIVGPSGCGKTTILNLLTGLVSLADGEISILGKRPFAGNPDIAYMLARDSLLPWRSTLDNASFGLEVRGAPRQEREDSKGTGRRSFRTACASARRWREPSASILP